MGNSSRIAAEKVEPGRWVEIHRTVLTPAERAPQVPEDTRRVPLEMRTKGFLLATATVGEDAEIETVTGRRLRGALSSVEPAYTHGFGAPVVELLDIAGEVRALLKESGDRG
jgi:hypothetical protein